MWSKCVCSVDFEVWSKLAKHARINLIASKFVHDFDCDWQRVNAFSHCVTLTRVLLLQIISYSVTKVSVHVVKEYMCTCVIYVYELVFLLHTSRSTEYKNKSFNILSLLIKMMNVYFLSENSKFTQHCYHYWTRERIRLTELPMQRLFTPSRHK